MLSIAIASVAGLVIGFSIGRIKNAAKIAALEAQVEKFEAKLKAEILKTEAYIKAKL